MPAEVSVLLRISEGNGGVRVATEFRGELEESLGSGTAREISSSESSRLTMNKLGTTVQCKAMQCNATSYVDT